MNRLLSLRRLAAMLTKEVIQMRRDRVTFAMMLGIPLLQLVLFGFAINSDPKHLPAALVAPTQDRFTRAIVSALELTGYYRFTHPAASAAEAESLITRGDVSFVVTVPSDFGRRVERGDRPEILIVEGLNVLQTGRLPKDGKAIPFVSDFFDFSVYMDADDEVLRGAGVTDFDRYAVAPGTPLLADLFLD